MRVLNGGIPQRKVLYRRLDTFEFGILLPYTSIKRNFVDLRIDNKSFLFDSHYRSTHSVELLDGTDRKFTDFGVTEDDVGMLFELRFWRSTSTVKSPSTFHYYLTKFDNSNPRNKKTVSYCPWVYLRTRLILKTYLHPINMIKYVTSRPIRVSYINL